MNNPSPQTPPPKPSMRVPDLSRIGYRRGFSVISFLLGLLGASIGGVVGYFVYTWILRNFGLDGLCIPGAMLGLGFGLAARRHHFIHGVVCGVLALCVGIVCEWLNAPFIADDSFTFFLQNLHQLSIMTWIMIVLGCYLGYSIGQGRR